MIAFVTRTMLALGLFGCGLSVAVAERLIVSVSTHLVAITSKFSGADLVVFGVIEKDRNVASRVGAYDVVIVARGPRQNVQVREKQRLGPIWVNRDDRRFADAPGFMAVTSSRPLQDIADEGVRTRLRLGLFDAITPSLSDGYGDIDEPVFRAALVRLKKDAQLFAQYDRGVTFLTGELFRAPIILPAATPIGIYDVDVILFSDGVPIARQSTNFELTKQGFERFVAQAAAERPWLYGLAATLIAVFGGWVGNAVFRRD